MTARPLILLTNDDGIHARGLQVLADHLTALGQLVVSAPDREQSAVGHGIHLATPLRVTTTAAGRFAVSGTPADAVLLGIFRLCPRLPDLVVSGINAGLNVGTDVFYSGTLAGALEGAIHGLPALAVSQDLPAEEAPPLERLLARTARFATRLAARLLETPPPLYTTLNVNAPATETLRFRWTRHGRRAYREQVIERVDPRGRPYFWIGGPPIPNQAAAGTDVHAVEAGFISITPLGLDLTRDLPGEPASWSPEGFLSDAAEGTAADGG